MVLNEQGFLQGFLLELTPPAKFKSRQVEFWKEEVSRLEAQGIRKLSEVSVSIVIPSFFLSTKVECAGRGTGTKTAPGGGRNHLT